MNLAAPWGSKGRNEDMANHIEQFFATHPDVPALLEAMGSSHQPGVARQWDGRGKERVAYLDGLKSSLVALDDQRPECPQHGLDLVEGGAPGRACLT